MHCSALSVTFLMSAHSIQLLFVALPVIKIKILRYLESKLRATCRLSHFT